MDRKLMVLVLVILVVALLPPTVTGQADHGPSLTVTYPPDGLITMEDQIRVNGTSNGTSVTVNGVEAVLVAKVYQHLVVLNEGANSLLIQASDAGGNITTKVIAVTLDTVKPVLAVTSPHFPLVTNTRTVHIEGVVEKGCRVTVDGKAATVTGDTFMADASIGNDTMAISVRATDQADNYRAISLPVQFDDQLNLSVTTRFDHDYHLNATESKDLIETYYDRIYIEGKTDPGASVTVDGNPIKVSSNGTFTTFVELKLGKNNITINVTDAAGNNVTGYLNVKRYYWEPFVVPVELAAMLLIIGLFVGTGGGYYMGRSKERKVQAQKAAKAAEDARAAQRPPKAPAPPKPRADMPEKPKAQAPPKPV